MSRANDNPVFASPFADILTRYLVEKRGVGYVYNKQAGDMRRFDQFAIAFPCENNVLSKELVEAWCQKRPHEKIRNQESRIALMQQLAKYMVAHGYSAYITPLKVHASRNGFIPYIFSDNELAAFFRETDKFTANNLTPTRHLVIPLLFRMLYGCGLRISEALKLTLGDIDFESGTLHIKNTKFDKNRKIVMADSLRKKCIDYYNIIHITSTMDYPFFPCKAGQPYSYRAINNIFHQILEHVGIYYGGRGNGPRIHDFRHTFAVHRLKKWTMDGVDLAVMLPLLSTYLGHVDMDGTQHYLRLTADLYPHITALTQQRFGHVVPKIAEVYNEEQ